MYKHEHFPVGRTYGVGVTTRFPSMKRTFGNLPSSRSFRTARVSVAVTKTNCDLSTRSGLDRIGLVSFSMSAPNPWVSIVSTSSMTMCVTWLMKKFPCSWCFKSRPECKNTGKKKRKTRSLAVRPCTHAARTRRTFHRGYAVARQHTKATITRTGTTCRMY